MCDARREIVFSCTKYRAMIRSFQLIFLLSLLSQAFGGNILFLSGVASPSHHIYNRALALGLAESGHNVTFVSADLAKASHTNLHYIHLEKVYDFVHEGDDSGDPVDLLELSNSNDFKTLFAFHDYIRMGCSGMFASKGLDEILNYPNDFKFDVAIHDFTCGPCLLPLIHKFNYPPLITVTAFSNPPFTTLTLGGQKYPAYIPHYMLNYPLYMSFGQRLYNTIIYAADSM